MIIRAALTACEEKRKKKKSKLIVPFRYSSLCKREKLEQKPSKTEVYYKLNAFQCFVISNLSVYLLLFFLRLK